jgi:hypothetical protein
MESQPTGDAATPPERIDEVLDDMPSDTHPLCKVCNHPARREIEVALIEGQSREVLARRFSTGKMKLNRQNLHSHYHGHMQVIDRAVAEQARTRARNAMLDVESVRAIRERQAGLRGLMLEQATEALAQGRVRWSAKDILQLHGEDAAMEVDRAAVQVEMVMVDFNLLAQALKAHTTDAVQNAIVEEYQQLKRQAGLADSDLIDDYIADNNPDSGRES